MTIQSPFLPRANVPFIDENGNVTRPWYLFLQNQFSLTRPDGNDSAAALAVSQAFNSDSTSQVAELQAEFDALDVSGGSPFALDSNATADSAVRGLADANINLAFMPSSPQAAQSATSQNYFLAYAARHG